MPNLRNYLRPAPRLQSQLTIVAVLLTVLAAWLASQALEERAGVIALERFGNDLRESLNVPPPPKPSRKESDQKRRWEVLAVERSFAWKLVLIALEQASNDDIELLMFLPDKAARRLVLRGESRDKLAVVEYIERLSKQLALKDVHLTHQKNQQRGQLSIIAFEIKATIVQ